MQNIQMFYGVQSCLVSPVMLKTNMHVNSRKSPLLFTFEIPKILGVFFDRNRRRIKLKVFKSVIQMCTRLSRCIYRKGRLEKIYFQIHENKTQECFKI